MPSDGIPDICTLNGLEKCPVDTPQEGHFVMGDGNLTTNNVFDMNSPFFDLTLAQICFSTDQQVEVCDADTDLAGIVVNDTDGILDGSTDEDACFFNACPAGTALEGVALTLEQNNTDTMPSDGIPDICTLNGLEKCPVDTPQEGHFVMGDGNLTTNSVVMGPNFDMMLNQTCNASEGEICPFGTQLAGVLVNDTVMDPMIEPACNPFEVCPADTVLGGVVINATASDNDGDMVPDVCEQENLVALIENCISYWLSLADGAARTGTINAIVQGGANLVSANSPPDSFDNYPFLNSLDLDNDNVLDPDEFDCSTNNEENCPQQSQLVDLMVGLLNEGYTLSDMEAAMKAVGSAQVDDILEGIFDCIGGVFVENCLQSSLSGLDSTNRTATITAIVLGAAALVESGTLTDDIDNYPLLASYKVNGDDDITDVNEFVCTSGDQTECPSDLQLVNLLLDLFNTGYTSTQMENAMLTAGNANADPVIMEIFDCLSDPLQTQSLMSALSSVFELQDSTAYLSKMNTGIFEQTTTTSQESPTINSHNAEQTTTTSQESPTINSHNAEQTTTTSQESPTINSHNAEQTTTRSDESPIKPQHEFRLPNLPFSFNGLGVVSEDPR
jgi:hypothetical protein